MVSSLTITALPTKKPLQGEIVLSGDKSLSHRAFMLSSLAQGETLIDRALLSEDVMATISSLRLLGVTIQRVDDGGRTLFRVCGRGGVGFVNPPQVLNCGNSGTAARLLCGMVAGHDIQAIVTGDDSLNLRPMKRITEPLSKMGALIHARAGNYLPLSIRGTPPLMPLEWQSDVPSAQVKSAILLAALHALGTTTITEPAVSRDHTEHMLALFGVEVQRTITPDGIHRVSLLGGVPLTAPRDILSIPSDPSSAALMTAAIAITGGRASFPHLLINPHRVAFFTFIQKMGVTVTFKNRSQSCGEQVADVAIQAPSSLQAITVPAHHAASLIDEYPALAIMAAVAKGQSRFDGLAELRHKESNRLEGCADALTACGARAATKGDSLIIEGDGTMIKGDATIDAKGDHRIAMAFIILSLASRHAISVTGCETIASSFPDFTSVLTNCGARMECIE